MTRDTSSQYRRAHLFVCGPALALVLWPLASRQPHDSFPLSTYPMFSQPRRTLAVTSIQTENADGRRTAVAPTLLGSSELLQSQAVIRHAVRMGPSALRSLCRRTAQQLERTELANSTARVVVVQQKVRPLDVLRRQGHRHAPTRENGKHPERVLAACPVN